MYHILSPLPVPERLNVPHSLSFTRPWEAVCGTFSLFYSSLGGCLWHILLLLPVHGRLFVAHSPSF